MLAALVRRGYKVLVPFGVNHRYDLVMDLNGRFVRAQCKTGRLRNGRVVYSTQSVRSNTRVAKCRPYTGEVEVLIVYCPELDRIYVVPIGDAPRTKGSLRVSETANGQAKGIRWAADYELPA